MSKGPAMQGVELLRALAVHVDVDAEVAGLDPATLRFVVEYESDVDVGVTAEQIRSLVGLDRLQFFPLFDEPGEGDAELGEFYVLQFPGLERTVDAPALFSIAHELQALLGAVSVEPDLGTEFYQDPVPPEAAPEGLIGDLFKGLCFVGGTPPADHDWALRRAGVLDAFAAGPARGAGIRIAQPDTGVTRHAELSDVTIADGFNVLTSTPDPTDPLSGGLNPGHGTGTASVMVSGPGDQVDGSAPEATLVPIRCIETVVLAFNGGAVAKAVHHARRAGCHIVTMSLGGTPSRALQKAVRQAIQADMIVLAAAGNCVGLVVYPARHDEVIAVAGSNATDGTWRGSCRGPEVDITAPAEKVWKAVAGDSGRDIDGGEGTSFAVAITAGVAALWLSHHGHATLVREAARRGMSLQDLFRDELTQSARTPVGWPDGFGAGIVDAAALLRRSLAGPVAPAPESAPASTAAKTTGLLAEAYGPERASRLADVAANPEFQLELSSLVFDDALLGAGASADVEAAAGRQPLSAQLEAALGGNAPALGSRLPRSARPPLRADDIPARDPVVLVAGRQGGLESAGDVSPEAARDALRTDAAERLGALEERVVRVRNNAEESRRAELTPLHDQLLRDSEAVLACLREDRPIPHGPGAQTALEALVMLKGRPALRLGDDGVDPDDPELGDWEAAIFLHETFAERQRSVGRVNAADGTHIGTGFAVGDGLVMTNRHVLEAIAFPAPRRTNPSAWVLTGEPVVNFSPSGTVATQNFRILDVLYSGGDPIERRINLAHLDLAILRVEQVNHDGAALPPALKLAGTAQAAGAAKLFVVGYPALPTTLPRDEAGKRRMDVVQRLREIYDMKYGVRYLSPGLVITPAAALPDSPQHWVFTHDATSLGGNSGSCVMSFDHELDVAGLHFAGDWLRANFAHAIDAVRPAFAEFVP